MVNIHIDSKKFNDKQIEEIKKGAMYCVACFRRQISENKSMYMLLKWADTLKSKYKQEEIEEMVSEAQKAAEEDFFRERID